MTTKFEALGLSAEIIKALKENKFEDPFPIQQEAIPLMLKCKHKRGKPPRS